MPDTTARFLRRAPRSLCIVHYALSIAALAALAARAADVARFVEYIESDGNSSTPGEYILLDFPPPFLAE